MGVNHIDARAPDQATQTAQRHRIDFAARVPGVHFDAKFFDFAAQRRVALGDDDDAMSGLAQIGNQRKKIPLRTAQTRRRDVFENSHITEFSALGFP